MTTYYMDYEAGNDSNSGLTFAQRWKTITTSIPKMFPGDTLRIMASPTPTSIGNATWTNLSPTVTLAGALTANISTCETAWTASANVTSTADTVLFREGTKSAKHVIAAGFTTGLASYVAMSSTDFSAYKQVSFWIYTTVVFGSTDVSIKLCSDVAGVTAVNTIAVPAISTASRWVPITVDTGGALGATIQSVALYINNDFGAVTIQLDNILACKDSASADSLTLTSLIGKNTADETFYALMSINGTTVKIDQTTNILPGAVTQRGYFGTTGAVTTYKRETIKTTMVAALTTAVHTIPAGGHVRLVGGYDRSAMTTQSGMTWFDGQSCFGYGFTTASAVVVELNAIGMVRYNYGINVSGASNYRLENFHCNHNLGGGILTTTSALTSDSYIFCCNNSGDAFTSTNSTAGQIALKNVILHNNTPATSGVLVASSWTTYSFNYLKTSNNYCTGFTPAYIVFIGGSTIPGYFKTGIYITYNAFVTSANTQTFRCIDIDTINSYIPVLTVSNNSCTSTHTATTFTCLLASTLNSSTFGQINITSNTMTRSTISSSSTMTLFDFSGSTTFVVINDLNITGNTASSNVASDNVTLTAMTLVPYTAKFNDILIDSNSNTSSTTGTITMMCYAGGTTSQAIFQHHIIKLLTITNNTCTSSGGAVSFTGINSLGPGSAGSLGYLQYHKNLTVSSNTISGTTGCTFQGFTTSGYSGVGNVLDTLTVTNNSLTGTYTTYVPVMITSSQVTAPMVNAYVSDITVTGNTTAAAIANSSGILIGNVTALGFGNVIDGVTCNNGHGSLLKIYNQQSCIVKDATLTAPAAGCTFGLNTDTSRFGRYFNVVTTSPTHGLYFQNLSTENIVIGGSTTTSVTSAVTCLDTGTNYLIGFTANEATKATISTSFSNARIQYQKQSGTTDNHVIYTDGGTIQTDTGAGRHTLSGVAWKLSPTSTNRSSTYPLILPLAKIAVVANVAVTVEIYGYRSNAGITGRLICRGDQIAGVDNDVTDDLSTTGSYELLSITFTPTEAGVVEIEGQAWGGTTFYVEFDDMAITQ